MSYLYDFDIWALKDATVVWDGLISFSDTVYWALQAILGQKESVP